MNIMKIFGREPTLYVAVIAAALSFFVGFGWEGLSSEHVAWINVVVNAVAGCVAAWMTKPIAPQAFTYAITSVFGLLGAYGLNFTPEMVSSAQFVVLAVLALVTRGAVSPTEDAPETVVLGKQ